MNIGYHRYLSHRSFELTSWFRNFIVLVALPAGTPVGWAGNHRKHHQFTDVEGDPHSPIIDGFWYGHCGWYLGSKNVILCLLYSIAGPLRTIFDAFWRPRTNQQYSFLAKDIQKMPFMNFISRPWVYTVLVLLHVLVSSFVFIYLFGVVNGLIFYWFCQVFVYNLGDSVDSIGHLIGERPFDNQATNHPVTALMTFGDGWHNNHHQYPSSPKHGLLEGQWDQSYWLLLQLQKLGLAYEFKKIPLIKKS